jgi:hypothetical protein
VVAIDVGGHVTCSGVLIAPDIVLSAGRCLTLAMPPVGCPAGEPIAIVPSPPSIRVFVSDVGAGLNERASATHVLVASGDATCHADLAFILLDTPIDDVAPLSVRTTGAAKGDRLRTVAFDKPDTNGGLAKLVRDHLLVLDATTTELLIGEPCPTTEGGPAVDEATGEVVGIALRAGDDACAGVASSEVYARTDVLLMAIGNTVSKTSSGPVSTRGKKKTKRGPIDMGANCAHGVDCAAGVCVEQPARRYCTRSCSPSDRCPAHFRCQKSESELWVCVEH